MIASIKIIINNESVQESEMKFSLVVRLQWISKLKDILKFKLELYKKRSKN